jgi:hypothetical protein
MIALKGDELMSLAKFNKEVDDFLGVWTSINVVTQSDNDIITAKIYIFGQGPECGVRSVNISNGKGAHDWWRLGFDGNTAP